MKRRVSIVAMLVIGLLAATGRTAPAYGRVISSAQQFQQYFRDLKKADTMSPIERFVFSLVLANSKTTVGEVPRAEAAKAEAGRNELPLGST